MSHQREFVTLADYVLGLQDGRQKMFGTREELTQQLLKKKT